MSLLVPAALALAAMAIVPLIIHLWRRRIGARHEFPAVRYLARAEREHSRRLRLRNLLLMFARVAAVLLLALAASRPNVPARGGARGPTALAIVLDNSASATLAGGGTTTLRRLLETAQAALGALGAEDRAWVITADAAMRGGSPSDLAASLEHTEAYSGAPRMAEALELAAGAGRAQRTRAASILVLTDGQRSTWDGVGAPGDVPLAIYRHPVADSIRNRAVLDVRARPRFWLPRGSVTGRVLGRDSLAWRVTIGAPGTAPRTAARGVAAGGGELLVTLAPSERGWMTGAVELEPDELRIDDRRHFAVYVGSVPRVSVHPSAGTFAERAVAVLVDEGRLSRGPGIQIASAASAGDGPALLLAPSDPLSLGAANRTLARRGIPWRFGAAVHRIEPVRGGDLAGVESRRRYSLEPAGSSPSDTVARAGGAPWIVAGRNWVLVASPLDTTATTLPIRAAFLPWLHGAIGQQLSGVRGMITEAAPGERVEVPSGARALLADRGELPTPGGIATAPSLPGAWRWIAADGAPLGVLVVNPDTAESRLEWLRGAELGEQLDGTGHDRSGDAIAAALSIGSRRPIGPALAWIVLAILVVETLLAAERAPWRSMRARAA